MDNFQVDGQAPILIPMMEQENYPVKMGNDPDLGCTVPEPIFDERLQVHTYLCTIMCHFEV